MCLLQGPGTFFSNRYDPVPFAKGYRVTGIGGKGTGSLQVQQHGTLFAGGIFAEKGYRGSHIGEKGTGVRKEPNTVPFREIGLRGEQFHGIGQIWSLRRREGEGASKKSRGGRGTCLFRADNVLPRLHYQSVTLRKRDCIKLE